MKLLLLSLLLISTSSFAQIHYSQKLYHFIERRTSDTPGDTVTTHFIFIEVAKDSMPIWTKAIIDGSTYTVHSTRVETLPLEVGVRMSDKRKVVIRSNENNSLWKLEFDLEQEAPQATGNAKKGAVILKGTMANREISRTVSGGVELEL